MTQAANYEEKSASGSGTTIRVDVDWEWVNNTEIVASVVRDSDGLAKTTDDGDITATVATDESGDYVTVQNYWPGSAATAYVSRRTPQTQEYNPTTNPAALDVAALMAALDKIVRIIQEQANPDFLTNLARLLSVFNLANTTASLEATDVIMVKTADGVQTITYQELVNILNFGEALIGTVPIGQGGTGADDEADARQNLKAQLLHNGFETAVTVTWDDGTRTVAITTEDYRFNVGGQQFHKIAAESLQIDDVDGWHFVYYDAAGDLVESDTAWDLAVTAPVAVIYWNSSLAVGIAMRENHSAVMDEKTHANLHSTRGTQYVSGGGISGYTLATNTDAGITFSITECVIADEDLRSTLQALPDAGPYRRMYRSGASGIWTWTDDGVIPVRTAGGGNVAYNQYTGGAWQLTEITVNNTRVNYYVAAVPCIDSDVDGGLSFAVIPGQATFTSLAAAQKESFADLSGVGSAFQEVAPLYQLTMKYSSGGGGTSKAEIEAIQDLRSLSFRQLSVGVVGDHQTLSNRQATAAHPAASIDMDTSGYAGILSSEDNVQSAIETIEAALGVRLRCAVRIGGTSTPAVIQSGFGYDSLVDNGTGDYTLVLEEAVSALAIGFVSGKRSDDNTAETNNMSIRQIDTTNFRIYTGGGTPADFAVVYVAIFD